MVGFTSAYAAADMVESGVDMQNDRDTSSRDEIDMYDTVEAVADPLNTTPSGLYEHLLNNLLLPDFTPGLP